MHTGAGDDALDIHRIRSWGSRHQQEVHLGGGGTDVVSVIGDEEGDPVVIDLRAGTATSGRTRGTFGGFEDATGDLGNDVLRGDAGPNELVGSWGEDRIIARGGDDLLDGQEDPDSLDGGRGSDRCSTEVISPTNCEAIVDNPARASRRHDPRPAWSSESEAPHGPHRGSKG